jgi:hypothetical protein
MVSGILDKSFSMTAYMQNGKVTFAVHHKTGTAYYSEKDVEALVEHIKAAGRKND